MLKIEFSHIDKSSTVNEYYFTVYVGERGIMFYTYRDLSGFKADNYGYENPADFIYIGTAILQNMEYIKECIKTKK